MTGSSRRARIASILLSFLTLFASSAAFLPAVEVASARAPGKSEKAPSSCACHHCPGVDKCCCEHGQTARGSTCDPNPEEGQAAQNPVLGAAPVLMICLLPVLPERSDEGYRPANTESTVRRFPPDSEPIEKVPISLA